MTFKRWMSSALLLGVVSSFNLDIHSIEVVDGGGNDDYFGYSVLLQKGPVGGSSSVLVGAPKSNSTFPSHRNLKEPGAVFNCPLGGHDAGCRQYLIDGEGNSEFRESDYRYNYKNKKDGGLLGASLDGGDNVGDPFVVCSPRWTNDRTDRNGQHYLVNGMCYLAQHSDNVNETAAKMMPLLHSGKQGYTLEGIVKYYYANGEVGTSIHYLQKNKEVLLGAPGVLSWKGTVVRYKTQYALPPPPQRLTQRRQKRQASGYVDVPNPVYLSLLKEENSYFGYAVSSGMFDSRYQKQWYAGGAPRSQRLYGLVMLYEYFGIDDADLVVHRTFTGDQMGAYFGASLLATAGNNADDLLVGAPTYALGAWDEGCVYFFKNDGSGNFESPVKIFGSKQAGSRFGTAISSVGDIDLDGYQDVAIAAPYEDGSGAVYIYLGSERGLSVDYSQKISAKSIAVTLSGFGFSLSKAVDVDHNQYNDIAVGAYKSSQVAVIKSRPVIRYHITLTPAVKELSVDTKSFNVSYCIKYESAGTLVRFVDTDVSIAKDARAIGGEISQTVTLTLDTYHCDDILVKLKGNNADYTEPISIKVKYDISPQTDSQTFCASCPVTNPNHVGSKLLMIPFANGCGSDNLCQPDLTISASLENNLGLGLVIGGASTLKLKVKIENKNEPAYITRVYMKLPPDVEVARVLSKCELDDQRTISCTVGEVLFSDSSADLTFDLDVSGLYPEGKELRLHLTVDSKGEDLNVDDNHFSVSVPLLLENQIEIVTKSTPEQISFEHVNETFTFMQEYVVKNAGPSPLLDFLLNFDVPTETDEALFKILNVQVATADGQLLQCNSTLSPVEAHGESSDVPEVSAVLDRAKRSAVETSDFPENRTLFVNCSSGSYSCVTVSCLGEDVVHKNQHVKATFALEGQTGALRKLLDDKDILIFSSSLYVAVNNKTTEGNSKTALIGSLADGDVSYWIYALSAVAALGILAVLTVVLYKMNFFARPVRERLYNETEGTVSDGTSKGLDDDDHDYDEGEMNSQL